MAMAIVERLGLWMDPEVRPGPEAMAVDEWLLETAELPVLRVYRWLGCWGSVGYFGDLVAARAAFPGVSWVRRWTGGGTVDHRADWTYTLVVPHHEPAASLRAAESYRLIHAAVAAALVAEGVAARLSTGAEATGMAACFDNPVGHDVIGDDGRKLAGAGQRRTRRGLLHQGSVVVAGDCSDARSQARALHLASALAATWVPLDYEPQAGLIAQKTAERYGRAGWTERVDFSTAS